MQEQHGSPGSWMLRGLAFAGFGYTLFLLFTQVVSVNLDGAMYMHGATRLLQGGLPYIDFVDINPPLAYYLHTLPAIVTNLTGLALTNSFLLLLLGGTLISSVSSYKLLTGPAGADKVRAAIAALTPALLLIPLQANFDLGQRPHLFSLVLLPYLIVRLQRSQGIALSAGVTFVAGFLLGVMTCLKPFHYAAILLVAELLLLARYRNIASLLAPEILAAALAALAYGALILLLPAASAEAFFGTYLPLILESYASYGMRPSALLGKGAEYVLQPLVLAVTCGILMRSDSNRTYRELALLGAAIAVTGALLFWIQGKGWAYHAIPVWFGGYLAASCGVGRILSMRPASRLTRAMAATPVLLILALSGLAMSYATKEAAGAGKKKLRDYVSEVVRAHSEPGDTIYVMSTSVDAAYPLLPQLDRQQATRFPFLFPLPMLYDGAAPDANLLHGYQISPDREQLEQSFLATVNRDLEAAQPSLILVERYVPCLFCPANMSLPNYIEAHAVELPVFGQYDHTGFTKRFKILVRREASQ